MSAPVLAMLAVTVFLTSLLSGTFGVAGGLILLWVLLFLMPVATAIAVHGMVQVASNGSRAWFTRGWIDRRRVITTKAAAQVVNHATKVVFYWSAAAAHWRAVALALPLSVLGTRTENFVLHRMTDTSFRRWTRWTRWIVTGIGLVYLARGIAQLV